MQYASTSLVDAATALLAKYKACQWNLADGFTDYVLGGPAADGQPVRAIADSGYGSSVGLPVLQPNPRNRVPYGLQDPHFALAVVIVPGVDAAGVVFQASHVQRATACDLRWPTRSHKLASSMGAAQRCC